MAVAGRRARVIAEAQEGIARLERLGVDRDPGPGSCGCDRPLDPFALLARIVLELPDGEGEQAPAREACGGGAEQGETPIGAGDMVEDAHQDHELEGAGGEAVARGARGEEIVQDELGGSGGCGGGELAPGGGEQGRVGVDAGVLEGEARLGEEAGETRVPAADVEHRAERAPAGGVQQIGGEHGQQPLPARPGARAAVAIEGVRMRLVEGPIDLEKLLPGRAVHGRRESRAGLGACPHPPRMRSPRRDRAVGSSPLGLAVRGSRVPS